MLCECQQPIALILLAMAILLIIMAMSSVRQLNKMNEHLENASRSVDLISYYLRKNP